MHKTHKAAVLQQALKQFTGAECYYYTPLFPHFRYTDGVKYLAEEAAAYWLIDAIFSHQINPLILQREDLQEFQLWTLIVHDDQSAHLNVSEGNGTLLTVQALEFTDFPLPKITLYFQNRVLFLPSEY
jgi:hypothetical protein